MVQSKLWAVIFPSYNPFKHYACIPYNKLWCSKHWSWLEWCLLSVSWKPINMKWSETPMSTQRKVWIWKSQEARSEKGAPDTCASTEQPAVRNSQALSVHRTWTGSPGATWGTHLPQNPPHLPYTLAPSWGCKEAENTGDFRIYTLHLSAHSFHLNTYLDCWVYSNKK